MVQTIRDIESTPVEIEVSLLLQYLSLLQEGRVKPDNTGKHSYIRESLDNINDITAVKERLNSLLRTVSRPTTITFSK